MRRRLDIPTEVENLLYAAERHDAAAIVYDRDDRVITCNNIHRHVYKHFDDSPNQTYLSLSYHVVDKGLLDDPVMKSDINRWLTTAIGFRRRHKLAQYLIHHNSGKTFLAHHQVFDGFGSIALRFDISNRLKFRKMVGEFSSTRINIFSEQQSFYPLPRNFEVPTAILSRSCSLISANKLFFEIIERGDGIIIRENKILCKSDHENTRLQHAVMEKSFPGASGSRFIKVPRKIFSGYYILSVFPMSPDATENNPSMHGVSLVSILDPKLSSSASLDSLRRLFNLTAVEAKVAILIGEGKSLHEISVENERSIGTVRNQLKAVFSKIGVSRQSDLVRIIHHIGRIESVSSFT